MKSAILSWPTPLYRFSWCLLWTWSDDLSISVPHPGDASSVPRAGQASVGAGQLHRGASRGQVRSNMRVR